MDLIARAGGRRTAESFIPHQGAVALFRAPGVARFLQEPRALVQQLAMNARYDTRQAERILAGSGAACPPFESYVSTLVATVQERFRERLGPERAAAEP